MVTTALGRILALSCTGLFVLLSLASASPLQAAPDAKPTARATLPAAPVQSIFHIEKSENRNQVHYAIHVDDACRPLGDRPVYAYWRELERGPNVVSPLLERERPAYGVGEPRSISRTANGGQVQVNVRAIPKRALLIETFRAETGCAARVSVTIQKQPAVLTSVYVDIGMLLSVNYALVRGVRIADGRAIEEKLYPSEL